MSLSYYDNLDSLAKDDDDDDKIITYEINTQDFETHHHHLHQEDEDTLNDSQLDDIIKHVNEAEELTKQLEKEQIDYEIIEPFNLLDNTSNFSIKTDNLTVLSTTNDSATIGTPYFIIWLIQTHFE